MSNRNCTKQEYAKILTTKVESLIAKGYTPTDAVNTLTQRQYDFLIEQGIDFDDILLGDKKHNVSEICRQKRSCSPNGYNKQYPIEKQNLYNGLCEHIASLGGEIIPRDKPNYRDLDFTLNGTKYRIVLSNPRQ